MTSDLILVIFRYMLLGTVNFALHASNEESSLIQVTWLIYSVFILQAASVSLMPCLSICDISF